MKKEITMRRSEALRETARRLSLPGVDYSHNYADRCNCGHSHRPSDQERVITDDFTPEQALTRLAYKVHGEII